MSEQSSCCKDDTLRSGSRRRKEKEHLNKTIKRQSLSN
jgi:hypothetical protein